MLLFLLACPAIDDQEYAARLDLDEDGVAWPEDCDDRDPEVSPEATEVCDNGLDDDCDEDPRDCLLSGDLKASEAHLRIDGEPESYLGWSLELSDLDGDGLLDVAAGAPNLAEVALMLGPIDRQDASLVGDITLSGEEGSAFGIDLSAEGAWLAVGAPGVDQIHVYEGGEAVALLDLWQVDASSGFAVALDSSQNLAVTAPLTSEERGEAYLVMAPLLDELSVDMRVVGQAGERIGNEVALADLDGDGESELLVSSTSAEGFAGVVWACSTEQSSLGTEDCQRLASGEPDDYLGVRILVEDLDQDGHSDLVVGASGYEGALGAAGVFLGPLDEEGSLEEAEALLLGMETGDRMGSGLAAMDLDGDGSLELLTGTLGGAPQPGRVALHEAPFAGMMDFGQARVRIEGPAETGFGLDLVGGELTGEGRPDILVAAPLAEEASGALYLFRGEDI